MKDSSTDLDRIVTNHSFRGRRVGRSIGAIMAGAAVAVIPTLVTDAGLQVAGLLPSVSNRTLLLSTAYRTLYGVIGGYVVARLAPRRPMLHALTGGAIGLAVSIIGAAATWDRGLGPHWYPLALIALAMPQAWAGGELLAIGRGQMKSGFTVF